ncbi:aminoacyl-tRNA hydrolase, partial [candidate division KSB1 bacterium]
MSYTIVGLGNPGEEYKTTRHNAGRILLERFRKKNDFPEWTEEKKHGKKVEFLISKGKVGKHAVTLILPELFMNKSGASIKSLVASSAGGGTSKKKAEQLVVVYDDVDLGFSDHKISFGRGSGGHNGIESIIKSIKTKDFVRVRVGISPTTPGG